MTRTLPICLAIFAIIKTGQSVSTKLDFEEEKEESPITNTSKDNEDVEVKHTIVVSTKLRNNNRRGLHSNDGDSALTYSIGYGPNSKKEDSGEVPVIKGYKSVDSTIIRTPDTRDKPPIFTDSVFINRNIRDGYDTYPIASNPVQWKPSTFFNNVNWWRDDSVAGLNNYGRRNDWIGNRNQGTFHRKVTDDGVKEFYCRKCRELSTGPGIGCVQQRSNWFYESTTPKIKIDGKLVKFN